MAYGIIKEELKEKIKQMYKEEYPIWKIARECNVPEAVVVKVVGKY